MFDKIKCLIEATNNDSFDYSDKYLKPKVHSDDDLPLEKNFRNV